MKFKEFFKKPNKNESLSGKYYQEIILDPEFKKWFGDSKVVDAQGLPLAVFHSTNRKEIVGDLSPQEESLKWSSFGVYFSSDRKRTRNFCIQNYNDIMNYSSEQYQKIFLSKNDNITKTFNCFIKIEKPLILENHEDLVSLSKNGETRESLMSRYDGIIVKEKNSLDFPDQYIVFEEKNIKTLPSSIDLHND